MNYHEYHKITDTALAEYDKIVDAALAEYHKSSVLLAWSWRNFS